MTQYPDISGTWELHVKVLRQRDPQVPPSFKDITAYKRNGIIRQHGPFFFFEEAFIPTPTPIRIGGLIQEYGKWKIYISDVDDFATMYATITKITPCGRVMEITGINSESGFVAGNPKAFPHIAIVKFKRIE